jgi:hypothetical protein
MTIKDRKPPKLVKYDDIQENLEKSKSSGVHKALSSHQDEGDRSSGTSSDSSSGTSGDSRDSLKGNHSNKRSRSHREDNRFKNITGREKTRKLLNKRDINRERNDVSRDSAKKSSKPSLSGTGRKGNPPSRNFGHLREQNRKDDELKNLASAQAINNHVPYKDERAFPESEAQKLAKSNEHSSYIFDNMDYPSHSSSYRPSDDEDRGKVMV